MEYNIRIPNIPNMGDLLNKEMLESIFQVEIRSVRYFRESNISGIGSSLSRLLYSNNLKRKIKQKLTKYFISKDYYIWGTGFMNYPVMPDNNFIFRRIHVCSLRGQLSKERIENILGKNLNVPLGDGGLLADRWVGNGISKKYDIGIIPHYKEQDSSFINQLKNNYPNSVVINLRDTPIDVVRQIAACRTILSSSLHGLIVSDSFHIPNKHILLYRYGERMLGDGFKFADYYSSFGIQDQPLKLYEVNHYPTIDDIVRDYKIDGKVVEEKKEEIFNAFPR